MTLDAEQVKVGTMGRVMGVRIPSNRTFANGRPKAMDGLNEIIKHDRTHRNMGARIERENVEWCAWHIKQAMVQQHWQPMLTKEDAVPVGLYITFVEANARRDVPNIIGGGLKYVLDALSRPRGSKIGTGAIYDDSPRWLVEVHPRIEIDPEAPGIALLLVRKEQS